MSQQLERLQKRIANSGYTSRRKAETLIEEGKVQVNGKTVTELGTKVRPSDEVTVEGIPLEQEDKLYILFYKLRKSLRAFQMIVVEKSLLIILMT